MILTADPLPEITLFKDGEKVPEDEKHILKIESKDLENGLAQYTCTINILGGRICTLVIKFC